MTSALRADAAPAAAPDGRGPAPASRLRRIAASTEAILAALVVLAHAPLLAGQVLFFRDLAHYAAPMRDFAARALAHGQWPGWNPYQGLGFSTHANPQYGLFYPPNLLFQLFEAGPFVGWFWLLHAIWGGIGCARLCVALGARGRAAPLVAGLGWSLGGFLIGEWSAGMRLPAAAWLPWMALGAVALVDAGAGDGSRPSRARAVVRAAIPVAASGLFGEVFVTLMGLGLAAVALVARVVDGAGAHDRRARFRIAAMAAAAVALGLAVAAVTWLPAMAAVSGSERRGGLARELGERCSLHPLRIVETVAPGVHGDAYGAYPAGPTIGADCVDQKPLVASVYFGASVVALALLAWGGSRHRATVVLSAGAALALLVALGRHTPVHHWLTLALPPLGLQRHPEKYFVVVATLMPVLAGLGVQRWRDAVAAGAARLGWRRLLVLPGLALLGLGLASTLASPGGAAYWRTGMLHAGAAALAVALVAGGARSRPRLAAGLLVGVVALDLLVAVVMPLQQFGPAALAQGTPPVARQILADGATSPGVPPRLHRAASVDAAVAARIPVHSFAEGQARWVTTLAGNLANLHGIAFLAGYDPSIPARLTQLLSSSAVQGRNLLRLLAVDHAVLVDRGPRDGFVDRGEIVAGARLHAVQAALPRAFVAGAGRLVTDADAPAALAEADVVDGRLALVSPEVGARFTSGPPERIGDCTLDVFQPMRVEATCVAARAGLAVFVEQHDAGWRATLDGAPVPLLRANLVARAVAMPPGRHRIVMTFHPAGLGAGLAVSTVALLGLLALALVSRLRASSRGPSPT